MIDNINNKNLIISNLINWLLVMFIKVLNIICMVIKCFNIPNHYNINNLLLISLNKILIVIEMIRFNYYKLLKIIILNN